MRLSACAQPGGYTAWIARSMLARVEGEMAWATVEASEKKLPYRIYEDVERAIALLHSGDLVFGDLRMPNIMVVPGGSGADDGPRGMLVDFDWVGAHGSDRYPASLDTGCEFLRLGDEQHPATWDHGQSTRYRDAGLVQ